MVRRFSAAEEEVEEIEEVAEVEEVKGVKEVEETTAGELIVGFSGARASL